MNVQHQDFWQTAKHAADAAAAATAFGTLLGLLPALAAFLSIAWLVLRFIEWAERRYGLHILGGRRNSNEDIR